MWELIRFRFSYMYYLLLICRGKQNLLEPSKQDQNYLQENHAANELTISKGISNIHIFFLFLGIGWLWHYTYTDKKPRSYRKESVIDSQWTVSPYKYWTVKKDITLQEIFESRWAKRFRTSLISLISIHPSIYDIINNTILCTNCIVLYVFFVILTLNLILSRLQQSYRWRNNTLR